MDPKAAAIDGTGRKDGWTDTRPLRNTDSATYSTRAASISLRFRVCLEMILRNYQLNGNEIIFTIRAHCVLLINF